MQVRYTVGRHEYQRMTTAELRSAFLVDLFEPGHLHLLYTEVERAVIGAAIPTTEPLRLEAGKELAAEYFCERREAGVLNIGGPGAVEVDGVRFEMDHLDALYIGRGARSVSFHGDGAARFHIVSYPAHAAYPTTLARKADANAIELGSPETSNHRTIYQYIHEKGIRSCQLVMGFTQLHSGSVWNTMPSHTHERRTEIYLYFDFDENARVFHFMGPADETRHLALAPGQAVISPMWSIHSGCGTRAYTFCWAMGGENQRFDDMDAIPMQDLK